MTSLLPFGLLLTRNLCDVPQPRAETWQRSPRAEHLHDSRHTWAGLQVSASSSSMVSCQGLIGNKVLQVKLSSPLLERQELQDTLQDTLQKLGLSQRVDVNALH
jgi:hypothetical protein